MKIEYLADHPDAMPQLAAWHHETWADLNPGLELEERLTEMRRSLQQGAIPTTFVALSDGSPLGSASLVEHDMHTRRDLTPWLASVFVAPEHRRRGIGSALVSRVMDEARTLGVRTLHLFTPDRERFYARMGWATVERTRYRDKDVVIMRIDLAP